MRIVLFGKNGQLGSELWRVLLPFGNVTALGSADLDFGNPGSINKSLEELKPHLIFNAAAYTDVDRAETETEKAMKINGEAPGVMAETAKKIGAALIHYSTDYVFDGTKNFPYLETDAVCPINAYGNSKLAGEVFVKQASDAFLILRTSWVYSLRQQGGFVNKVLQWSRQNETLRIVDDQIGSPTWARMLAECSVRLIPSRRDGLYEFFRSKSGIYHLAGMGSVSRLEWAREILRNDPHTEEQKAKTILGVRSSEFPTPARRPLYTALDCARIQNTFNLQIPQWDESLRLAMKDVF